jgi:aspartokinase-like uncharacterized kinase
VAAITCVVKIGGSLFDLPDLGPRLQRWLDELDAVPLLLVPGGGPMADLVRDLDQRHGLGEEKAHWLALRAMTLNAWFLADLLPDAVVVPDLDEFPPTREKPSSLSILDAFSFALRDERRLESLPHGWAVTSDSVAARVAVVAGARQLILLKSVMIPEEIDWTEAGRRGFVDTALAEVLRRARTPLEVRAVNLRDWSA